MNKVILVICLAGLLCNCATTPKPVFTYNEVVILNQSRNQVSDVKIAALDSGRMFSCGNIAPRGICSDSFRPQPYQGKPIQIAWMIANGTRHSKVVELALPQDAVPGIPLRGVLVIGPRGDISAYFQQDAPGPHL